MMYFLTTIQEKNNEIIDRRCVGYFETYEEAANIILHNFYDINETIYNYAVIEAIPSGIYQYDNKPHWFAWIENGYIESEVPPFAKNVCGYGIG